MAPSMVVVRDDVCTRPAKVQIGRTEGMRNRRIFCGIGQAIESDTRGALNVPMPFNRIAHVKRREVEGWALGSANDEEQKQVRCPCGRHGIKTVEGRSDSHVDVVRLLTLSGRDWKG